MNVIKRVFFVLAVTLTMPLVVQPTQALSASILDRVMGYILLQVESHGEAWYVDPVTQTRYYMKDGSTAYEMMRTFGLGVSELDYQRLVAGDSVLLQRLLGRIILRVEQHGEAYYIHPEGNMFYLADGPAAYQIMRQASLGISNQDLTFVPEDELSLKPYTRNELDSSQITESEVIQVSPYQAGASLTSFSAIDLNQAWLETINAERSERGLTSLVSTQNLVDASASWAAYIGSSKNFTHTRPDGSGVLNWGQIFVPGASAFGENLASVTINDSAAGLQVLLDQAMALFMAEEPDNGVHFQNVVNASWKATAVGVYFVPSAAGTYQAYAVFQFADVK